MELDHIFMFCSAGDGQEQALKSLGLVETYRRKHPGQGTENMCFCFDNAFVELLWINDESKARSPAIARTALFERARHRDLETCPFGIAWRGHSSISTWPYRPPYLPPNLAIDVAVDGDDPRQPMMFKSPGNSPPSAWPADRRGHLQHAAGFQTLRILNLAMPEHARPSHALGTLAMELGFSVTCAGPDYRMEIEIGRASAQAPLIIPLSGSQSGHL